MDDISIHNRFYDTQHNHKETSGKLYSHSHCE